MNFSVYFFSPFEQFIIIPIFSANLFIFGEKLHIVGFPTIDYIVLNLTLIFLIFLVTQIIQTASNETFYVLPTSFESHFHLAYLAIQSTLQKQVHVKYYQQMVFLLTVALLIFLLLLNFFIFMSLTSQFAVISAFSLRSIFGIFFLC